ncbi:DUF3817 domain-containing protein [Rhodococcus sp. BP-149]|jgi:integral membrane protein|uniref:DUF3817 domain-containing protein n=1 Tax=unclassified Rhodococcus (in: high G+C Gram-positive bacteria) TaxID=192944 RepID=UPI0009E79280|nr:MULTISPECIES: DUF3817 domain-containing protein [unclassified Rhodococcus (in: high G+C Gram-positive bacteria)]MBY6676416.1 DUF3817 domain-containing protein [Rhodococcus sp. BP-332]MBY6681542.1 DUF3817 domain-containing protein [Rhodococcus sp. BP-316]MBY6686097.1 DUF3817 domain-containing protein [Rhodococcus sp. BP-288]MBY6693813.1 DUF3817 domain-containing protein [Rhodococcus sp. BP-188]MBY6699590.1 DUF3817 domain-containing protein [Rhodococcus sp. BP-285]
MADNQLSSTAPAASSTVSQPPIVRWFRVVAVAEAVTWVALLIGMAVKYVPDPNIDSGVRIPGMLHGAVFVLYLVITVLTALALRWSKGVTVLALLASIPPFGTIVFEVWASRTGRLVRSAGAASPRAAAE